MCNDKPLDPSLFEVVLEPEPDWAREPGGNTWLKGVGLRLNDDARNEAIQLLKHWRRFFTVVNSFDQPLPLDRKGGQLEIRLHPDKPVGRLVWRDFTLSWRSHPMGGLWVNRLLQLDEIRQMLEELQEVLVPASEQAAFDACLVLAGTGSDFDAYEFRRAAAEIYNRRRNP